MSKADYFISDKTRRLYPYLINPQRPREHRKRHRLAAAGGNEEAQEDVVPVERAPPPTPSYEMLLGDDSASASASAAPATPIQITTTSSSSPTNSLLSDSSEDSDTWPPSILVNNAPTSTTPPRLLYGEVVQHLAKQAEQHPEMFLAYCINTRTGASSTTTNSLVTDAYDLLLHNQPKHKVPENLTRSLDAVLGFENTIKTITVKVTYSGYSAIACAAYADPQFVVDVLTSSPTSCRNSPFISLKRESFAACGCTFEQTNKQLSHMQEQLSRRGFRDGVLPMGINFFADGCATASKLSLFAIFAATTSRSILGASNDDVNYAPVAIIPKNHHVQITTTHDGLHVDNSAIPKETLHMINTMIFDKTFTYIMQLWVDIASSRDPIPTIIPTSTTALEFRHVVPYLQFISMDAAQAVPVANILSKPTAVGTCPRCALKDTSRKEIQEMLTMLGVVTDLHYTRTTELHRAIVALPEGEQKNVFMKLCGLDNDKIEKKIGECLIPDSIEGVWPPITTTTNIRQSNVYLAMRFDPLHTFSGCLSRFFELEVEPMKVGVKNINALISSSGTKRLSKHATGLNSSLSDIVVASFRIPLLLMLVHDLPHDSQQLFQVAELFGDLVHAIIIAMQPMRPCSMDEIHIRLRNFGAAAFRRGDLSNTYKFHFLLHHLLVDLRGIGNIRRCSTSFGERRFMDLKEAFESSSKKKETYGGSVLRRWYAKSAVNDACLLRKPWDGTKLFAGWCPVLRGNFIGKPTRGFNVLQLIKHACESLLIIPDDVVPSLLASASLLHWIEDDHAMYNGLDVELQCKYRATCLQKCKIRISKGQTRAVAYSLSSEENPWNALSWYSTPGVGGTCNNNQQEPCPHCYDAYEIMSPVMKPNRCFGLPFAVCKNGDDKICVLVVRLVPVSHPCIDLLRPAFCVVKLSGVIDQVCVDKIRGRCEFLQKRDGTVVAQENVLLSCIWNYLNL